MIQKLKDYLIQVAISKYLPMAGMAAVAALGGLLAAHSGMLEQYGITYFTWPLHWPAGSEPSGACILIELDTLSAKAIAAAGAVIAVAMSAAQHHTTGDTKPPAAPPEGMV